MERLLELLSDTDSFAGLAATTVALAVAAAGLRLLVVPLVRRRHEGDHYRRYWAGKLASYAIAAVAVIALVALWAPFGGRFSVILGFATAGIAFAMQEVIGALFGWVNILGGRIYTVGDRIEVGGVRGDVMDISPLRTTVLEIGSEPTDDSKESTWVSARQPTGRVVTVSNRKTFTEPVFNYSAHLEWIWEELSFAVPQGCATAGRLGGSGDDPAGGDPGTRTRAARARRGGTREARRAIPRLARGGRAAQLRTAE